MTVKEQVEAAKAMSLEDICHIVLDDLGHRSSKTPKLKRAANVATAYLNGKLLAAYAANELLLVTPNWRHPEAGMIRARLKQIGDK